MLQRSYKKVLAVMLAITLGLSSVVSYVTPIWAETPPAGGIISIDKILYDGKGGGASKSGGTVADSYKTIYFGSYWQDGSGGSKSGYSKSGIKWRVLANDNGNDNGKVLLLSDKGLYADQFNSDGSSNTWGTSEVRSTLNGLDTVGSDGTRTASTDGSASPEAYSGLDDTEGFAKDAFNEREYGAIALTEIKEKDKTTQDKLFLLSGETNWSSKYEGDVYTAAYGFSGDSDRVAQATTLAHNVTMYGNTAVAYVDNDVCYWLLRSPSPASNAFLVDHGGGVYCGSVGHDYSAVRPALNLNPESVLFLSAAVGGKKDVTEGIGFKLDNAYTGSNGWKMTLKDATINKPTLGGDALTLDATDNSTWKYSGASTGENKYVSAVLKDNPNSTQGNYISYAKLANASKASDSLIIGSGGTSSLNGNYYMFIFGEEANDDYLTDYASEFSSAIPVTFTGGKLKGMTLDENYTDASNAVTLKNGFTLTLANATYSQNFTITGTGENTLKADENGTTLVGTVTVEGGATLTTVNTFTLNGTLSGAPATIAGSIILGTSGSITNTVLNFNLDGHKAGDIFIDATQATNPIDLSSIAIGLVQTDTDYKLAKDEKMTLITKAEKYQGDEEVETRGGVKKYLYSVGLEGDALMLGYLDQGAADQTKSFSEARLAASAALNSASDLVATSVIDSANTTSKEWKSFVSLGGSHSRYETGSHVDLNMFNVAAGLSKVVFDNLTLGVFAEGGSGRYSTENNFAEGVVTSDGNINYFGGGVFAKVEGKKTSLGHLHGEASFRAGYINSKYDSDNFNPGTNTSFNLGTPYVGIHAGFGYKWALAGNSNVDTYMKYFWNRQGSDNTTLDGERFDFDAINSHRLRLGARYNGKSDKNGFNFFGGLAYEYEFDGKAKGHMGEYALLEPDFKGGSGMAEIGFKFEKEESPWRGELALQGFTGKRDSIGANLSIWYMFGK